MSWQPPPRPDWVRALLHEKSGPLAEEAALPLTRDALLGEAAARQGRDATADAFGRPGFEAEPAIENLDRLLDAVEREATLHALGRVLTRRFLLRAEYKSYVVFTSRDENEEVEEWKVGFAFFL